eukprot:CAMPEP_0172918622 /NCGR_PEP_ID=MMETSP1075-20121228/200525_1 /TAXON_ID=2916 /ORGANISM="Ceratium fusus, Strain PA161109" /LENGTH=30 /DNA_ID= /DNA_START= /DNA_END= /DNA_ORIENTATION=
MTFILAPTAGQHWAPKLGKRKMADVTPDLP